MVGEAGVTWMQCLRAQAHCSKSGGGVAVAWLNIGDAPAALALGDALGEEATLWVLSPGAPIDGAVSPLQSRAVLLNGETLVVVGQGTAAGPTLPNLGGVSVETVGGGVALPAQSYGFAVFADAVAPACAL